MRTSTTFAGAAALLAAVAPAPVAAQSTAAPAAAAPARWHLDGATNRCVLSRRLEGTPAPATFILRTIPGSGRYDVIVAAPDLPGEIRRPGRNVTLSVAPGGQTRPLRASHVDLPDTLGDGAAFGPLPPAFAQEFARASTLQVADEQGRALGSWTIPIAARAAEAVAACEAEKLVDWGADPAGFEPGATPPRPIGNVSEWLSIRDFGLATALTSAAYTAVFRLALDAEGRPTGCELMESAGNVDLHGACRALSGRARYEPARDAAGNPIRSVAIHMVSFRMETTITISG